MWHALCLPLEGSLTQVAVRTVHISHFENSYDNVVKAHNIKLSEFVDLLTRDPSFGNTKEEGEMWSPAKYSGDVRKKADIVSVSCLPLDFDKGIDGEPGLTEEDEKKLFAWLSREGYYFVCHTSFSSGFVAPRRKLRVVLFFERNVLPQEYNSLWDAVVEQLPVKPDRARRDYSGNYYSPRIPEEHKDLYEAFADGERLLRPEDFAKSVRMFETLNATKAKQDQLERVVLAAEKHTELNGSSHSQGMTAAHRGEAEAAASDRIWKNCKAALERNTTSEPVKDWAKAERDCRKAVADGYRRVREELKEKSVIAQGEAPDYVAEPGHMDKAEAVLAKAVKVLKKDLTQVFGRAKAVGRFTPHIISTERATRELFEAYLSVNKDRAGDRDASGQFLGGAEVQARIDTGIAKGAADPAYVRGRTGWSKGLLMDENGPQCCEENAKYILARHPELEGKLRWNVRKGAAVLLGEAPWEHKPVDEYPTTITEDDGYSIGVWLAKNMGNRPLKSARKAYAALKAAAHEDEFDPFQDWLETLKWDGTPRLDTWLIDHAQSEDTAYTRLVSSKFVLQAVARTYEPGCKVDHVLVLIGTQQGEGKSAVLEALCGKEYFCSDVGDIHKPESSLLLEKYVIVEMPELAGLDKRAAEDVKRYISNNSEELRAAYRMDPKQIVRRAIIGGTTNVRECLRDETGGRRFWPVEVFGSLDIAAVIENKPQLWAEAVSRYKSGEAWWPKGEEVALCETVQEQHLDEDDLAEDLEILEFPVTLAWLTEKNLKPIDGQVDERNVFRWVTVAQVYALLGMDKNSRTDQFRVKGLARLLKWKKASRKVGGYKMKVFELSGTGL